MPILAMQVGCSVSLYCCLSLQGSTVALHWQYIGSTSANEVGRVCNGVQVMALFMLSGCPVSLYCSLTLQGSPAEHINSALC
jgi:hypothetical protein